MFRSFKRTESEHLVTKVEVMSYIYIYLGEI
jgi:hypothetical protein